MVESTTSGFPPAHPCGVCSNGPVQIYHYGGPCPYTYTAGKIEGLPGARGIDTGDIHRAPLMQEISEKDEQIARLQAAAEHWLKRGSEYEKMRLALVEIRDKKVTRQSLLALVMQDIARAALPTPEPADD